MPSPPSCNGSVPLRHVAVARSVSIVTLLLTAGCGSSEADAVWTLDSGQDLDADTTTVRVLVTRLGCNGGVTGQVQEPNIDLADDAVALTFSVRPGPPDSATCPGNDHVPYEVVLPEPLGQRALIDGRCRDGESAASTAYCQP